MNEIKQPFVCKESAIVKKTTYILYAIKYIAINLKALALLA
jgi:hypothetical protein